MASLPPLRLPSSTSHHRYQTLNPNLSLSTSKPSLKPYPYLPSKPKPHLHLHLHASLKPNPNPDPKPHPFLSTLSVAAAAAAVAAAATAVSLLNFPSPPLPTASPVSTAELRQEADADGDVSSLSTLLETKISSGELAGAAAVADRLLSLRPGDAELRLLKARLQARSGDATSARGAFEAILDKDPLKVEAYHGLVMAAAAAESGSSGTGMEEVLKRIDSAMEICKEEGKRATLRDFKLLRAQILVTGGDYEESLKIYEDLVSEEPGDFRPYLCQGIIYSILGRKEEAGKRFDEYRRLVPDKHPHAQFFDRGMEAVGKMMEEEEEKRQEVFKN